MAETVALMSLKSLASNVPETVSLKEMVPLYVSSLFGDDNITLFDTPIVVPEPVPVDPLPEDPERLVPPSVIGRPPPDKFILDDPPPVEPVLFDPPPDGGWFCVPELDGVGMGFNEMVGTGARVSDTNVIAVAGVAPFPARSLIVGALSETATLPLAIGLSVNV